MAIDQALLGNMAAKLMERLESEYGEDAKISAAGVVVAVDNGDGQKFVQFDFGPELAPYEVLGLLEYVSRHIA
jgi:hypothetical protein